MLSTARPEGLDRVLRTLGEGLEEVLGPEFVFLALQGSFALGDWDRDSDCDFVVATRRPLSSAPDDPLVLRLQALHGGVFDRVESWAQHLEGSYFDLGVLGRLPEGEELWYLDNGSRGLVRSDHCNTLVVRHVLRERGVLVRGEEPRPHVVPVVEQALRAEMKACAQEWSRAVLESPERYRNRFNQGYLVLNLCRIWCDFSLGEPGSKRRGAAWAKERLGSSWAGLIDRAWSTRPNPARSVREEPDPEDFRRTLALVREIGEAIAAS